MGMKKRTAAILKWVGIVVVVLGFVYGAMDFASRRAIKREYDALRAEGRPMELREIVPPAIPDADNAALVYNAAIQMLKAEPLFKLEGYAPPSDRVIKNLFEQLKVVASEAIKHPTNTVTAEHMARLLDHPRVVEFLAAIERGSARPGYRQEVDYSQGAGILMPDKGENLSISKILSVLARQQAAADGRTEAAWSTAMLGIRFADSLRDEPIPMSHLVRVGQLEIAVDALRAVVEFAPPSGADVAKLEALLASFDSRKSLVRSLDGDRLLLGEWVFKQPASAFTHLTGKNFECMMVISGVLLPFKRTDHAAYLRIMRYYACNAAEPYAPGDAGIVDQMINAVPRYCMLTRSMVPALSATKAKFTAMIAKTRVTRNGLAAIRFKQEHGAFPSDLQALKLANADDPFTGKPLIYRPTDRGFTIYSVGMNVVDDGGTKGNNWRSGDEVWRYEERNPAEQRRP
jgi:hypothetical protein